jgi:hypothetical protein
MAFEYKVAFLCLILVPAIGFAGKVRRLSVSPDGIVEIRVSTKGTTISFPSRPQKVLLGRKNSFGLEYVENDIGISPLSSTSASNLTAYLDGRRYAFKLITSEVNADDLILIRDSLEKNLKIKVKYK